MNRMITFGKIKTSKHELVDITKAWVVISLAFAFVFSGITLMGGNISQIFSLQFLILFVISLFTAGLGFLLHELGHKVAAQKYGCQAEFRAFDQMLYLALGLAFLVGFIFAAPGAVMIAGRITHRENGIISLAGPAVNYVLALIFLGLMMFFGNGVIINPIWKMVFSVGFQINLWLGLFNLIPFGNFDGIKIFRWNPYIWTSMVAFGVYFIFF
jgi:Zn-dependent protease